MIYRRPHPREDESEQHTQQLCTKWLIGALNNYVYSLFISIFLFWSGFTRNRQPKLKAFWIIIASVKTFGETSCETDRFICFDRWGINTLPFETNDLIDMNRLSVDDDGDRRWKGHRKNLYLSLIGKSIISDMSNQSCFFTFYKKKKQHENPAEQNQWRISMANGFPNWIQSIGKHWMMTKI